MSRQVDEQEIGDGAEPLRNEAIVTSPPVDHEALIRAAGDAVIAAGTDGSILLWNDAAERIFGYTEREALGRSLDLIVPERFRSRHWQGYREVMRTGRTRYGVEVLRVPAVHKDGRPLSIAFTVTLLYSPAGKVQAIAAIIRDETIRWNEERALHRRLAELEAECEHRHGAGAGDAGA
jgi:PAS domain S-box-containing protein